MKEFVYVLNYSDGKVYRFAVDDEDEEKTNEQLLADYGFDMNEVEFFYSTVDTNEIIDAYKER